MVTCLIDKSPLLTAGLTVFVTGRSHQRGFLIVEYNQQQIHVPHQFTELKVRQLLLLYCNAYVNRHPSSDSKQPEPPVIYELMCVHYFSTH